MSFKNSRGMTLIELLIVLALVVSLAGMATAGFVNFFRDKNPRFFVKEMTSYVRYLQFKAIEEGKIHKLSVEPEDGTLRTYTQTKEMKFAPVHDSLSKRFEVKSAYELDIQDGKEIYFFPDGTITRNEIHVLSDDHKIASLSVRNRLGALKVELYV